MNKVLIALVGVMSLVGVSCSTTPHTVNGSNLTQSVQNDLVDEQGLRDIEIIRQYYLHLANGELEQAYDVYADKNPDFDTFVSWYKDVVSVNLIRISKQEDGIYQVQVDLIEKWPGSAESYVVVMEVVSNKIRTVSAKQIIAEPVTISGVTIESQVRFEKSQLMATKNGETHVIDEADADYLEHISTTRYFYDVIASPLQNYFTYNSSGWEWGEDDIVSLDSLQEVARFEGSLIGFSKDETILYQCVANDFSGSYHASIYSVPEFTVTEKLIEPNSFWISRCEIKDDVLEISYMSGEVSNEARLKTYNMNTREIKDELSAS